MKMKLSKSILALLIATTMILTLSAYANTPIEVPQLGSEIPSNITEEREAKDISEGNKITIPSGLLLDDNEDRTVSDLEDQKKFNESKMLNEEDDRNIDINKTTAKLSEKEIENLAFKFATTSFSDFSDVEDYCDDLIDINSTELLEFISDKREINNFKQNLFNRKLSIINKKLIKSYQHSVENNLVEVLLDIKYSYLDGDLESGLFVAYKIYIDSFKGTVVAAMSNDLSSGTIIPEVITMSAENLDVEYQLPNTRTLTTLSPIYDTSNIKNNLENFVEEISNENISRDVENFSKEEEEFSRNTMATYVSFSSSDRSAMRKYQDNYWYQFNNNYANFSSLGGDCTNYASQVLNSSNSPQYSKSNSGIYGSNTESTYWYYRSSSNRSTSWTKAEPLKYFLLNNYTKGPTGTISSTFGALDSGDVIQLLAGGLSYHSIVVYLKGGDPYVTAHSDKYSGYYASRYGGINNVKIRVTGYYK